MIRPRRSRVTFNQGDADLSQFLFEGGGDDVNKAMTSIFPFFCASVY